MPPLYLLVKPASSLCNMRCKYCFYHDVVSHRQLQSCGMMEDSTLEAMVRSALQYADGDCAFGFQGGEPTLAGLDFYRRLLKLQKDYNVKGLRIHNSIQTNGMLIDDEWAGFLAENDFLVGLSIDGPKDIHDQFRLDSAGKGTHSRLMKTVSLLKKHNAAFNVLCVVNNAVARYGRRVYNFFKQQGIGYLQFIPCLDPLDDSSYPYSLTAERYAGFLKMTFDLYYEDVKNGSYVSIRNFDNYVSLLMGQPAENCGMNGVCSCCCVVEGDGSVYPCDFYVLDRYCMGNVHTQSFDQMIHSDTAAAFVAPSRYVDEACRACRWFPICKGGCRRHREPFVKGRPGLNRFCAAYQAFFPYALPRLRKLAAIAQMMRAP